MGLSKLLIIYFTLFLAFLPNVTMASMAILNSNNNAKKDISLVNTRWIYSPFKKTKINNTTIGSKTLIRYMQVGSTYIPVAHVTLMSNQSITGSVDINQLKEDWTKRAFPDLKWQIQENSKYLDMEAFWPQVNKYINVHVQKLQIGNVSIVTTARIGYLKLIYKDLQDIRNSLIFSLEKNDKKVVKTSYFNKLELLNILIEKAFAQTSTVPILPGIDPTLIGGLLGGTNIVVPGTVDLNTTVNLSGNVIVDAGPGLVTSTENMKKAGEATERASQNTVVASQNMKDTSQTMDSLMRDNTNAARMAASVAAGAAVGTLAANLVISGISSGADYIWNDLLFDKANKKIRWDNFKMARDEIDKTENAALELEKQLDSLALAMQNLKEQEKKLGPNFDYGDLLKILEADHDKYLVEAETFRILATKQSSRGGIEACLSRASELEKAAKGIDEALQFAKKNKINSVNKTDFFCEQFETYKRKLMDGESTLVRLNTMLVAGKNEYFKFREEEIEKAYKDSKYINEQNLNGGFLKANKNVTDSSLKYADKLNNQTSDYFIEQCMAGRGDAGRYVDQVYKKALEKDKYNWNSDVPYTERTFKYFDCRDVYNLLQKESAKSGIKVDFAQVKQQAYENAEKRASLSSKMHHGFNAKRIQQDLDENMKWFEKKETENQCYQLLGQEMTSTQEQSCNRIAPKLMSLYRSHQKANDLWVNNCQDSYETAITGANINDSSQVSALIARLRAEHPL